MYDPIAAGATSEQKLRTHLNKIKKIGPGMIGLTVFHFVFAIVAPMIGWHSVNHSFVRVFIFSEGVRCIYDCVKAFKLSDQCFKQEFQAQQMQKMLKAVMIKSALVSLLCAASIIVDFTIIYNYMDELPIWPLLITLVAIGYLIKIDGDKVIALANENIEQ